GGDSHYTTMQGREKLRQAVADRHARRTGEELGPENVMICSGAQNALYFTAACLVGQGDHVVVLEPAYVTYHATFSAAGAEVSYVAMPRESGFRLDAAALEAAIRPETKVILFANPNNPTGVMLREDEVAAIAAIAERHDLWIVADEVYGDLVFEGSFVSMASAPAARGRTVTISSLSKSHAMTGWRLGWLTGPRPLVEHCERLNTAMLYGLPGFIQEGAYAALTLGDEVPDEMAAIYRQRRDVVLEGLRGINGLSCMRPQAGMFMMVDVAGTGLDGQRFMEGLYEQTGVSVLAGGAFGPPSKDCVRVSFAASEAQLAEGCKRIRAFVAGLNGAPA
ncbi:pyridoxal phosphate-dependent aminotransferase, partial [Nostoc sp. NIES-2111]